MESPSIIDLVKGAFGIRVLRKYRSLLNLPDMVFVSENLAFGGFTSYLELEKKGITTILDLRAETLEEKIDYNKLKYKKIKIIDNGIPTNSQICQIVSWIKITPAMALIIKFPLIDKISTKIIFFEPD